MVQIGLPVMFTFNYNLPYDSALLSRSPKYRSRAEKVLRGVVVRETGTPPLLSIKHCRRRR